MRSLSEWLFSPSPVVLGMLCIIVYLMLETTSLLYVALPDTVTSDWMRWALSIFLSIGFHGTVLNISVNGEIISRWFAVIVALLATVLTMFFFNVFELSGIALYQSITFSVIVGFCGYTYVFLFVEKFKRQQIKKKNEAEIVRLTEEIREMKTDIQAQVEETKRLESANESLTEKLKERPVPSRSAPELIIDSGSSQSGKATNGKAKNHQRAVPCDFCSREFSSRKSFGNRKTYCRKEPEQCKRNHQRVHESQEA